MRWQEFEKQIKKYSQVIWSTTATAEVINGVKCDCVVKHKKDYWIIIEISKSNTLGKIREDLAKFSSVRPFLLSQEIYAECIFVTEKDESSLKETGEGRNVTVLSKDNFFDYYLGSNQYTHARISHPFGSAIDQESGKTDDAEYLPIEYFDSNDLKFNISDIVNMLQGGAKIIVLGEFGSGKSRCVMELFKKLCEEDKNCPPLTINLREIWGLQFGHSIIREHISRFGLTDYSDNLIKSITLGNNSILLDGFDELGSQTWSNERQGVKEVRKKTFVGIRDLLQPCQDSAPKGTFLF